MKYKWFLLLVLFCKIPAPALAQCQLIFNGSPCLGDTIYFFGASNGTNHKFDFNGEGIKTGVYSTSYVFKTAGAKTVTYTSTVNGSACTSSVNLVIHAKPVVVFSLRSPSTQCFEKNLFCFRDSSYSAQGSYIVNEEIMSSDAKVFQFKNPKTPKDFCFSIGDERGIILELFIKLEDNNGCIFYDTLKKIGTVREKIGARITRASTKNPDCDSTAVTLNNLSRISSNNVKTVRWDFGDGEQSNVWGPTLKHTFKSVGTYSTKLWIESTVGCKDSYTLENTAVVLQSAFKIISSVDSACISKPTIKFNVDGTPDPTSSMQYNFGDIGTGSSNFSKASIATHTFSKPGPFLVSFTYNSTICGLRKSYDTVLILGPQSIIEKPNNRIPQWQVYQCEKPEQDGVQFKNFSLFFRNDATPNNEDSIVFVGNKIQHVFNASQVSLNPKGFVESKNRGNSHVQRLWDFGDRYALKCTTDIKQNKFVGNNCAFSRDSIPEHLYPTWQNVFLTQYKNTYMEEGVFDENTLTCKRLKIYPSDSFYVISDSFMTIPASTNDSALSSIYPQIKSRLFLKEKKFYKGSRIFNSALNVQILSGEKLSLVSPAGTVTNYTGPAVVSVPANYQINTADSVRFLFTKSGRTDTIPAAFYQMRASYGDKPKIISRFKANYAGTKGIDYTVDFGKFRDLYYSKIPSAFDVKLIQRDMLHPMHCQSEAIKQVVMMNPKAGGTGAGLRIAGIPCFGGSQPNYGITFLLDGLKPGATFSDVQINYDSSCGKNNFTPLNGLQMGGLPPGLPYPGYELYGNTPSTFSHQYADNEICSKTGCPTIGIIVGNGVSKSGTKPLCADTQWYDNLVCFQKTIPDFKVNTQFGANNNNGYFKVCKYDSVRMSHPASNRTHAGDVSEIVYNIVTENAGPTYSLHSEKYIKEKYYYNSTLNDSGSNKYYNYLVVTRGGQDPVQIPGTNYWKNGNPKTYRKPDTIITARILQLDTIVDFSNAWEPLKNELILKGFDPYAIDGKKLHKMIWNKKGTIGNPASGARGCIDVSSFEMLLKYYTQPVPSGKIILHPRDTSLIPVDSIFRNGKWVHEYTFKPNHNGYYLLSRNMLSKNAACPVSSVYPCIVGFAHLVDYPDSIVSRTVGTSLSIKIDPRYFHPDPINFGTWDIDNNSWRKPNNGNTIVPTKWDWSKADDDTSKRQTIFGGAPYGGSGLGSISSPWTQLGGGGPAALYYNQDTGVYTFRCALTDSAGCLDTFTGRVYVTDLKAKFDAEIFTPSCNSIVDFKDKAELIIPHSNAKTESGDPLILDFINYWSIQWGDGKVNTYSRNSPTDSGLPYRVGHKYNRNGWYQIIYQLKTWQGGLDTFKRWVKIPGPRPAFEFATSSQKEITVNVNDEVEFINTSDSATAGADFTWFYGDGNLDNLNSKSNVTHTYTAAGDYMVFLQQYDTFTVAPNVKKFCPAIYPDTPSQPAYIVHVLDVNSIKNLQGSVISFYPNPTEGLVSIRGTAAKSIQVYSISGVYCGAFELQHGKCNLNALAQGTYVLTGTEPSGEIWKLKLVILRE